MPPEGTEVSQSPATSTSASVPADQFVPVFDNVLRHCKEFRKRSDYIAEDEIYLEDGDDWWSSDDYVYWQGDDGSLGQPWPDQDEDYYDDGPDEGENIYVRTARGLYPVVALVDKGGGRGSSPKGSQKGKGKGKGKKGHSKSTGSSSQSPVHPGGGVAAQRGRVAIGRQICLRCGQAGHCARNCPSNGSADKKRKLEADDAVMMVTEVYIYMPWIKRTTTRMSHASSPCRMEVLLPC